MSLDLNAVREQMAAKDSDLTRIVAKLALSLDHPHVTLCELQRALWSAMVAGYLTGQREATDSILAALRKQGAV